MKDGVVPTRLRSLGRALAAARAGRAALGVAALALAALVPAAGCSSKSSSASGPQCDPSQCAPGNACIDDGSGSGPSCHKVCTAQSDCPANWYCNDGATGSQGKNWCVQNTATYPQAMGQWGTPCVPTGGQDMNPACDVADQFSCYGVSPTDASAFCTQYDCTQDSDCPGGWWCATVDTKPNVTTATRSFGPTRTVCLPRQYCSTCQADHDCPAAADGTQQHCVQDAKGNGFCSPQCASNANCALDATCTRQWTVCAPAMGSSCKSDDDCPPASGTYQHCSAGTCTPECGSDGDCAQGQKCQNLSVCTPRAGTCVGDGGFCSPCRSDADCKDGYCLDAAYSTEKFCSQKASGLCTTTASPGCPTKPNNPNTKGVACTTSNSSFAPVNQCIGYVVFGTAESSPTNVPGCWTVNR